MREIKFRAWSPSKNRFLDKSKHTRDSYHFFFNAFNKIEAWKFSCGEALYRVDDAIIEQYTGLKDKNGREIYEGDILKYKFSDKVCTVKWSKEEDDCHPRFVMNDLYSQGGEVEAIGNIHENPELINATL